MIDVEFLKIRLLGQDKQAKEVLKQEYIDRDAFQKTKSIFDSNLIKAIVGPRRAGKTIFGILYLKYKDFYYVNFDDEIFSKIQSEDLGTIQETLHELFGDKKNIMMDEIQNIDRWELFANRLQREGYNIIVTGSNSHLLSSEFTTHLSGRVIPITILPFSFKEFLLYNKIDVVETITGIGNIKRSLDEYIKKGGYPEIISSKDYFFTSSYYDALLSAVLIKDISKRFSIRKPQEIFSITEIILNQFSSRTSIKKIAETLEINDHTVKKYMDYLENAYVILSSKKFSFKPRERESAHKKHYCIDTGFLLSRIKSGLDEFGKLMENIVAIELRRRNNELFYYMPQNKYEVDFVIFKHTQITKVIQVVYDDNGIPEREVKSGILACNELKCKNLTIITWSTAKEELKEDIAIKYIPLWKWLLLEDSDL